LATQRAGARRQEGKLKIGVDIPTRSEVNAIVDHVSGRWRPLIVTAILKSAPFTSVSAPAASTRSGGLALLRRGRHRFLLRLR
jgi:hypothetical protein